MSDWQTNLDRFELGYIEAMFFTEENGKTMFASEFSQQAQKRITDDCRKFRDRAKYSMMAARDRMDDEQLGRDFWLTRNGHGAGYWDRPELKGKIGTDLTTHSHAAGEVSLYRGDDGKLYLD